MDELMSSPAEFLKSVLEKISKSHNIDFRALISFLYILNSSYHAQVDFKIGNVSVTFRKWLDPLKMIIERTEEGVKFSTEILVMKYLLEVIEKHLSKRREKTSEDESEG